MSSYILADNVRGIYAQQHAARAIMAIPNWLAAIDSGTDADAVGIVAVGPPDSLPDDSQWFDASIEGIGFTILGRGHFTVTTTENGDVWAVHDDEAADFTND